MIQIKKNAIVVTIDATAPLERLTTFKNSLHRVLRFIDADTVESNSGLIYDIMNVIDLISELEFNDEQILQISGAILGRKAKEEHILID